MGHSKLLGGGGGDPASSPLLPPPTRCHWDSCSHTVRRDPEGKSTPHFTDEETKMLREDETC